MNKMFGFICAFGITLMGVFLVVGKEFTFRGTVIDFGSANTPIGIILIILGVYFFWLSNSLK